MVCQNCHSKDVIKVQDQFFCVNCGNIVVPLRPQISTPTQVVAPLTSGLPEGVTILPVPETNRLDIQLKRKRPGRPKAARLDMPAVAGGMRSITFGAPPTLEPPPVRSTEQVEPAIGAMTKSETTPARSSAERVNDITRTNPAPVVAAKPNVHQTIGSGKSDVLHPALFNDLMSASIRGRFNATHFSLALLPAILLAFVGGFIMVALAGNYTSANRLLPAGALAPLSGELLIISLLYYVSRSFMHGAIVYGAARKSDNRPAPIGRWIEMSSRSFGTRLRFDMLCLVAQAGVLALIVSLAVTGGVAWPVPFWLQWALLFGAFFALVYLFAGLMLAQGLGHVAVTLSPVSARQAFGLGWLFFKHHFDLIGIKILTLLVELILLLPLLAAVAALIILTPDSYSLLVVVGLVVGILMAGASTGAASALWWQSAYRRLVKTERLTQAVGLLTGRRLSQAGESSTLKLMFLMLALAVCAAIWPWVSL